MQILILPGYSEHNREWIKEIDARLKTKYDVLIHEWSHWENSSTLFRLKYEINQILNKVRDKEKVNIIAKSVGTRVLMNLIMDKDFLSKINKVIMCGIPTRFENETTRILYKDSLSLLSPSQFLILQNDKDPLAKFSYVNKYIKSINPEFRILKMPRNDHNYPYFDEFLKFL
ncbi:hypothetical protein A2Z22_00345 [Candidatus Woesebacteria bacterium RBG_16_34_12]|uniref:Alpha/beta hydrolase n=1 Tax=Candidatus Woesebacteria bacterium RBG_16_34_12 TaxID=1802480 RepID=A0A1F7XAV8_9BACT|nr:MAG: hypothetical protein A2Z22_00345 [Candidatus Woesebacteria bacterium RBG_16_34_12]